MGSRAKKDRRKSGEKYTKPPKQGTPLYARIGFIMGSDKARIKQLRDRGMMPDQQPVAPTTTTPEEN